MKRSGFTIVKEKGHFGLQNEQGEWVLPCEYDKILDYDDDGYIRVIKGQIYGTVDLQCRPVLSHDKGLNHLGVFYNGTARARKGPWWGLVDVQGEEVTGFIYKEICAHRDYGYSVVRNDGKSGILADDGTFSNGEMVAQELAVVKRYHNGIAPAKTLPGKWIFVDEQKRRVNSYEYDALDAVLREGVYYMNPGYQKYGACFYDGKPIVEEQFDYPLKFVDGLSVCKKKRLTDDGKEIRMSGGQPRYDIGVLRTNGTYLFPMVYYSLHWNDYDKKDCWFAEDDEDCYLLFPDGTRKVYRKEQAVRGRSLPFIPEREIPHDHPDEPVTHPEKPKLVALRHFYRFQEEMFEAKLRRWTGRWGDSLKFYYCDTDAPVNVKKYYKKGTILRCGHNLEVSENLGRPVHKLRFLIASIQLLSMKRCHAFLQNGGRMRRDEPEQFLVHKNDCFLVKDVTTYLGVTQITLLHLPLQAMLLTKEVKMKVPLLKIPSYGPEFMPLVEYVRRDLHQKFGEPIHGHSLSDEWVEKMYLPPGVDESLKPVALEKEQEQDPVDNYYDIVTIDKDSEWKKNLFVKEAYESIQIYYGDLTRATEEAIVNPIRYPQLGAMGLQKRVFEAGGPELLEACRKLPPPEVGQCAMTEAYDLECQKVIHTVGPVWQDGAHQEAEQLASCYEQALRLAAERKLKSIAFPCIGAGGAGFPFGEAARIALTTVFRCMKEGLYLGRVVLCCYKKEETKLYEDLLKELNFRP